MLISPLDLILKPKILLNFAHGNKAKMAVKYAHEQLLNQPPFRSKVYFIFNVKFHS